MKRYWSVYIDDKLLTEAKIAARVLALSLNAFLVSEIEEAVKRVKEHGNDLGPYRAR